MIEFMYREERLSTSGTILRPVAKVYLPKEDDQWVAEYFYVDSGADYTLIPYRLGHFLGLDRRSESEVRDIGGIGGVIGTRRVNRPMKIGDHTFPCELAWAQVERVPLLLGREGVFDHFDVTFQQTERKIVFQWRG